MTGATSVEFVSQTAAQVTFLSLLPRCRHAAAELAARSKRIRGKQREAHFQGVEGTVIASLAHLLGDQQLSSYRAALAGVNLYLTTVGRCTANLLSYLVSCSRSAALHQFVSIHWLTLSVNIAKLLHLYTVSTGDVDHFQSEDKDRGWGCGWRNIQMVCSHLLRHDKVCALPGVSQLVMQS